MNCEQTRAILRERFDAGRPLGERLGGHLDGCDACRRYHDRLEALERSLARLPLELPTPGFAARTQRRIEAERSRQRHVNQALYAAAAVSAVAAAAAIGWFYPVDVDPRTWGTQLRAAWTDLSSWDWRAAVSVAADAAREMRHALEGSIERLPSLPDFAAWPLAAVLTLFLVVFNGLEVRRSGRHTGEGR